MRRDVADVTLRAMARHVATQARVPIGFLDPRHRAMLLIHGYNVNEAEAAAVPVQHVETAGLLEAGLAIADTAVVLHSDADTVLSQFFPLGQTVGRDGWFPEAVGLHGRPQLGAWSRAKRMHAFDHDDYWGELETAALVAAVLGFTARRYDAGIPLATRKSLACHRLAEAPLLATYVGPP